MHKDHPRRRRNVNDHRGHASRFYSRRFIVDHDNDRFGIDLFVSARFAITTVAGGTLMACNYASRSAIRPSDCRWRVEERSIGVDPWQTIDRYSDRPIIRRNYVTKHKKPDPVTFCCASCKDFVLSASLILEKSPINKIGMRFRLLAIQSYRCQSPRIT